MKRWGKEAAKASGVGGYAALCGVQKYGAAWNAAVGGRYKS
jgi:hypothetical protein